MAFGSSNFMGQASDINSYATLISFFNIILLITSVICIAQFFFSYRSDHRRFHTFNLIFTIVFYWIALAFLFHYRSYYFGFEHLSRWECIRKLFFTLNPFVFKHWIIAFAFVLNIIYLTKTADYY